MSRSRSPDDDPPLAQNPHRVRGGREAVLEVAIGREVRALRLSRGLTGAALAAEADLSPGMLSKIENGQISPSLATLQSLAAALRAPVTRFFRRYEAEKVAVHTPAGSGVEITRTGTRAGHQYSLLGHLDASPGGVVVEPYLITLTTESDVFPTFQHDGVEFIYMLTGRVDYRHGTRVYALRPGDTLFFDADAPHGPDVLVELPATYLSVISYPRSG